MEEVIRVENLVKVYGKNIALKGISFSVRRGEIFSILGPNGAGKTTTVEILEGVRKRTSGNVSVLGEDPNNFSAQLKEKLGIVFQETALFENITVKETLNFFKKVYSGKRNIEEVMESLELKRIERKLVKHLSGGQKRRLLLATLMVHDPEIVFLDEPTTGLDPAARRKIWEMIRKMKSEGKTIILTTHYMEEAQELSDRVMIMNDGEIVEMGTVDEIIKRSGLKSIVKAKLKGQEKEFETERPEELVVELLKEGAVEIQIRKPNLDDVFLHLTGGKLV